jgi:type 1 fimbria pilin
MPTRFRKLLFLLLLSALSLLSRASFADDSCYIHSTNGGTYTTGASPLMVLTPDKFSNPTDLGAGFAWVIQFLTSDPVGCKFWTPYDNTVHFINAGASIQDTQYSTPDGNALFKTTVPGIDYTVQLICYVSDGCGTNHPTVDLFLKGTTGTDNTVPSQSNSAPYTDADSQWKLQYRMWVTPEFKPQKGVDTGYSLPGTLAYFRIGPESQAVITFMATPNTIQFRVPASSCSFGVAQGNSVSGNNVALGDYWINDIKNNNTQAIPFAISLENCYTPLLKIKMTSGYVAPGKEMLGKSSGTASGVAIKVMNTDKSVIMVPNSATSTDYDRNSDWSSMGNLNFTAQLLPDGSTVKAGDFNAAATFQMDYE